MNELKVFSSDEFGSVRTLKINNEPWFVGKDVADILGYENQNRDIVKHIDEDDRVMLDGKTQYQNGIELGQRGGWIINESGVYSLILRSNLPKAKKFKRWITHDVIPTIRKTGGYVNDDEAFVNNYLPFADEATKTLFRSALETIRKQNEKIEADKPKVLYADAVSTAKSSVLVGELAKILRQNGVDIGQNRLFQWMRENGYLISRAGCDRNMPTQRSMDMGLLEIKETVVDNPDGSVVVRKTVKVSGKGQQYFVNKFLAKAADSTEKR